MQEKQLFKESDSKERQDHGGNRQFVDNIRVGIRHRWCVASEPDLTETHQQSPDGPGRPPGRHRSGRDELRLHPAGRKAVRRRVAHHDRVGRCFRPFHHI